VSKHDVFEYAIVRIVPRVEREEFLNVGIILYCPAQQFLHTAFELNEARLLVLDAPENISGISAYLSMFEQICAGSAEAGSLGALSSGERFRWLTAPRSTIVQTSPVHTGLCADAGKTLEHLLGTLVR
jgi:Protein of unknown function (DUF3037)